MLPRLLKAEIESALGQRFGPYFHFRERPAPEAMPTGIPQVDAICGGLPRGAITEIVGSASSGRTSLLLSILKEATARQEVCALVDTSDTFDPASAAAAGMEFNQLLWVRCAGKLEPALKTTDLLLQGGGFGVVILDLAEIPPKTARRIPLAAWFRFRRVIENTPAVFLVIEREPTASSCTSLVLELNRERSAWTGAPGGPQLFRGVRLQAQRRKPARALPSAIRNLSQVAAATRDPQSAIFEAGALG